MKKLLTVLALMLAFLSTSANSATIRILFVYTPQANAWLDPNYRDGIFDSIISNVNSSFTGSGITGLSVVRSGSYAIGQQEANLLSQWTATHNSLGVLVARDFQNADVVVTVVSMTGLGSDECGEANGISNPADKAFVVVDAGCMLTLFTLQHELGHVFGGHHNIQIDPTMTPWPQAHGFQLAYPLQHFIIQCAHTIMSYTPVFPDQCANISPRINNWSNPSIWWTSPQGGTGAPTGLAGTAEMALVIGATGPTVANYHLTKMYVGRILTMILTLLND